MSTSPVQNSDEVSLAAPAPLDRGAVRARLSQLHGRQVRRGRLPESFDTQDFVRTVRFVDRIAVVAEQLGHQPDLSLVGEGWW